MDVKIWKQNSYVFILYIMKIQSFLNILVNNKSVSVHCKHANKILKILLTTNFEQLNYVSQHKWFSVFKLLDQYKNYIGDGDSKCFEEVLDSKPYGSDFHIGKLKCMGHVQERIGRLRKTWEKKLIHAKSFGGKKGTLTDKTIDSLQY